MKWQEVMEFALRGSFLKHKMGRVKWPLKFCGDHHAGTSMFPGMNYYFQEVNVYGIPTETFSYFANMNVRHSVNRSLGIQQSYNFPWVPILARTGNFRKPGNSVMFS